MGDLSLRANGRNSSTCSTATASSSVYSACGTETTISDGSMQRSLRFADGTLRGSDKSTPHIRALIEEVVRIEFLPKEAIIGSASEGSNWCELAKHRKDRFQLYIQGGEICTKGGQLASEAGVTLRQAFQVWRAFGGIPATVPPEVVNRG